MYAVNPNGTEKWHYDINDLVYSSPAIGDDGTIYISSNDNHLYAIYSNGTLKWSFSFGDWLGSPAIGDDGTIYVASWDDYLYAIYSNGTLKWNHEIDWGSGHTPSIAEDGTIYIGQKYLYAIYPDGTRKWTFELGDPSEFEVTTSCAISADGIIYFGVTKGTTQGDIIAVNQDGTERWREIIADDWVRSSPAIGSDGTVYIGSQSRQSGISYGFLYAFGELDSNAPNAPLITGETQGKVGESYDYTFISIDPDGDDVWYYIEWGDGEVEEWFGPYDSGEEVVMSHVWNKWGRYTIRAKAKDVFNVESDWGTLQVRMPVNQQSSDSLFLRFLERFPNAFPIMRLLLDM